MLRCRLRQLFYSRLHNIKRSQFSDYTGPDLLCSTVFHFSLFFSFYFGSCGRLSWLNCQLSSARQYRIFTYLLTYLLTYRPFGDLSQLHWLAVLSRISFKIACLCLTYRIFTVCEPCSIIARLLEQPRVSAEFGRRSDSYLAPKIWHSLPLELRLSSDTRNLETPP